MVTGDGLDVRESVFERIVQACVRRDMVGADPDLSTRPRCCAAEVRGLLDKADGGSQLVSSDGGGHPADTRPDNDHVMVYVCRHGDPSVSVGISTLPDLAAASKSGSTGC